MSPQCNYTKYFQKISILLDSFGSLLLNESNIFHAWVSRKHFCEREQNPVFSGIGKFCWLPFPQLRGEKGCEIVIFWWFYDNSWIKRFVASMFWFMPSTCYAWLSNFVTLLGVMFTSRCIFKFMLWNLKSVGLIVWDIEPFKVDLRTFLKFQDMTKNNFLYKFAPTWRQR